jgi:hypothetical protein
VAGLFGCPPPIARGNDLIGIVTVKQIENSVKLV